MFKFLLLPSLALVAPAEWAQEPAPPAEVKIEPSRLLPPGWNLKATAAKPSDPLLNDPKASKAAPEEPTRSATSTIRVQNDTGWVIQIRVESLVAMTTRVASALSCDERH